ncbi:MAG TPA: CYTH domain-containing protein [Victivallales bacterium]|nr:CYTH domain-containing protein [Victivallales bacterium]
MGTEIERKFLLTNDNWKKNAVGVYFCQGYIPTVNNTAVRVRIAGNKSFITIKSSIVGITRNEFEYEIPLEDAKTMLHLLCAKPLIEKTRYKVLYKNKVWEIDLFERENRGLQFAEIELDSETEIFEKPDWIGREVTGDMKYCNSNLVKYPFTKWKDNEKNH